MTSSTELLKMVEGLNDEELDTLAHLVVNRQRALRRLRAMDIRIGDKVQLANVKPKYLTGTLATVTNRRNGKLTATLDDNVDPRALRRFGRTVTGPATIFEKVEG